MKALSLPPLEFYVLDDGVWPFPARFFFANVPEAVWRASLETDGEGKIPVGHNCGLLKCGSELILIDTGYGDDTHGGMTGHLLEDLERTGYRREDVTHVITTHAHGDHIKGNTLLRNGRRCATFPNALYHLARADWEWFGGPGHVPEFDDHLAPLAAGGVLRLLDAPLQITPEVLLLPTPGHTPGHVSVLIEAGGHALIFLGDLCHHPLHFSQPDWVSSFDTHPHVTPHSRARLFDLAIERDALLICPHAPPPGVGRLRRAGDGYEWQAVEDVTASPAP